MAVEEQVDAAEVEDGGVDGDRQVSTIAFPWTDLDNAIRVTKAVYKVGGTSLTLEQLAAELKVALKGGGFRLMYSAAKTFGLVTISQGNVTLTDLGRKINDPKFEKAAKAEALLAVPLYRSLYDIYKGGTALPPPAGLEAEIHKLGVVKKATERARQVFQKSAQQAGFFAYGTDKLVMPATGGAPGSEAHRTPEGQRHVEQPKIEHGGGGNGGPRHPFIAGLLKELPAEGADWPTADRVKWLKAAAMLFDFIYKSGDTGRPVRIDVSTESAK